MKHRGSSTVTAARVIGHKGSYLVPVKAGKHPAVVGPKQLRMRVKILDARNNYGRTDLLITPEAGEGYGWVRAGSVRIDQ